MSLLDRCHLNIRIFIIEATEIIKKIANDDYRELVELAIHQAQWMSVC